MNKLIVAILLTATIVQAEDVEYYDTAQGWTNSYNKWGDVLIDMYAGDQVYPQQPTNVFYKLWTNDYTHKVYTNIWREEKRPMTRQEKRDLIMTGWTRVYDAKTNLVGYTMKRTENNEPGRRTTYRILGKATEKKMEEWKKDLNDPTAVLKKNGKIIKATAEIE